MKSARISIGGLDNKCHTPLYILIAITLFTILSIIILSIRFVLTGAVGNEGNATLTNVSIKQAGTGQSVTIKGETLDEITLNQEAGYGTDDASRRIILNNNVVRYDATYNVTSPGIIELSITLPANNTIDEATIGSAQQCMNGSKLESADITNSDGTVTKSYTNNKATCIRNITNVATGSTLQTNWQITAYPWGSNNEQITPTLAINNQVQATKPEPITVVGRPNYRLYIQSGYGGIASDGLNSIPRIEYGLYVPIDDNVHGGGDAVIGIEPLSDEIELNINASNMPDGWNITRCNTSVTGGGNLLLEEEIVRGGMRSCYSEGDIIKVVISDIATATRQYGQKRHLGDEWAYSYAFYAVGGLTISSPVSSIPLTSTIYEILIESCNANVVSTGLISIEPDKQRLAWSLDSLNTAVPKLNWHTAPGWPNSYGANYPLYSGEHTWFTMGVEKQSVQNSTYATNMRYCVTWRGNDISPTGEVEELTDEGVKYEFGVLGQDDFTLNESTISNCGYVGDGKTNSSFFESYEQASDYAKSLGVSVNAIRATFDKVDNGTHQLFRIFFMPKNATEDATVLRINYSEVTDQYPQNTEGELIDDRSHLYTHTLVPGLLSHTLTAEPSSTNPGKEDHITITTKTYNKDTNAKITVNLPTGLSIKPGTITIKDPNTGNPIPLIEGETSDYTVSLNPTNTTKLTNGSTITFNLDNIATNHGINLTGYEPIYPGESGVTNIECNTASNTTSSTTSNTTNNSDTNLTCHEVITTNNNNTDDDPINDDLPIAADNNGNGIEHTHTPIEFDVVIDEDTPSPSTLTINSTASGTGTDYASSTFKSASDTITVADPPRTFGYDLTTSSNYVYAGDNLTYNYQVSNLTNNEVTNLDLVTVLPYNDDSRGTTGLIDPVASATNPYTLTNLTTSLPDGARLYYTIDTTAVRQIEQGKDTSALISDPSIVWQELDSNTIPTDIASKITALRLSIDNFAMDSKANFSITLTNILANNPTTDLQPSLASDITYLGYQAAGIPTLTSHTNLVKTSYEGNLLVLNPDKTTITTNLNPNEVKLGNGNVDNPDSLTNRLDITARTLNGYTVTMQVKGSDNSLLPISTNNTSDNTNRLIPAINTTPTAGLTGWAISLDATNANPTWQAVPAINPDADQSTLPLSIYQTDGNGPASLKLPIAYGVSTSQNTIADTYRAEVVYTLTAEL